MSSVAQLKDEIRREKAVQEVTLWVLQTHVDEARAVLKLRLRQRDNLKKEGRARIKGLQAAFREKVARKAK